MISYFVTIPRDVDGLSQERLADLVSFYGPSTEISAVIIQTFPPFLWLPDSSFPVANSWQRCPVPCARCNAPETNPRLIACDCEWDVARLFLWDHALIAYQRFACAPEEMDEANDQFISVNQDISQMSGTVSSPLGATPLVRMGPNPS